MLIKNKAEDFCVEEIMDLKKGKGKYVYFILKKKNWNTMDAINKIGRRLNISSKRFGFAGLKDKKAITEQYVSVKGANEEELRELKIKDIEIKIVGRGKEKIRLGSLKGNKFKIRVKGKIRKVKWIINYFGEQRFGTETYKLGREILKGKVPKKERRLLLLYVHAVQSYIWNKSVEKYLKCKWPKSKPKNIKIPLVGYETVVEDKKLKRIINKIMEEEKLKISDFRIQSMNELSLKGSERDLIMNVKDFKIEVDGKDSILGFELGKGSYATVVVERLCGKINKF